MCIERIISIIPMTMPAMAMPNNKPPIKESKNAGQYKGIFLLTMGGLWHVELTSTYSSGEQDTVIIPLPGSLSGTQRIALTLNWKVYSMKNKPPVNKQQSEQT